MVSTRSQGRASLAPASLVEAGSGRAFAHDVLKLLYHSTAGFLFLFVFLWHFTPYGDGCLGRIGFGRWFRYMTFWSWTIQSLYVWPVNIFADLQALRAKRKPSRPTKLAKLADDAASALFPLASVVTLMYYVLLATGKNLVDPTSRPGGRYPKPFWLSPAMHVGNSIAAWGDLALFPPRSFSPEAGRLSASIACAYAVWILVVRYFHGEYPYPFLNKFRQPHTFLISGSCAGLVFFGIFRAGRALHGFRSRRAGGSGGSRRGGRRKTMD